MARIDPSLIYLEIERSKLSREKARMVLFTSLFLYVGLTLTGVIGFAFDYISLAVLYVFIFVAVGALALGTIPYILIIHHEEKTVHFYIDQLRGKKK